MPGQVVQPVTWEWVEREIVRQIASRPHGRRRAKVLSRLLAGRLNANSTAPQGPKERIVKEHRPWTKTRRKEPPTGSKIGH
jgi:hypothetical protein